MSEYMRARRREEGDGFFCRFTFGQFFALLVLEVFTIFFVFYLGARYGREFLGLDKQKDVAAVEETQNAEEAQVLTTSDPEGAEAARKLMARAKTPELKDRIRQMIEGSKSDEGKRRPKVVERNYATKQPEVQRSQESPDASREKNAADTATAQDSSVIRIKSAENARYSVQVGSYPTMKEATRIIDKWKTKGYPAYMMIADIPDRGRWYRVRMGGFETRGDASRYMKELKTRENIEALVVLNEQ